MEFHILNGDALLEQFPEAVKGEKIVARECMIDGDTLSPDLDTFWRIRSRFMKEVYGVPEEEYFHSTVSEFDKVKTIPHAANVNLWFEYDLFCQVNMWFSLSLLPENASVSLVFPDHEDWLGFGAMSSQSLELAYQKKVVLSEQHKALFIDLWHSYQKQDLTALETTALHLSDSFPKLMSTVKAHIDRFPVGSQDFGKPERILLEIIHEYDTRHFGIIFKEFSRRAGIYGFGDLQVKRLLNNIK